LLDALWVILVDGEQSGGRFSIMEQWVRGPGPGPPLHVHGFSDECLYVLDGQMEIQVGQKKMTAGAGQSVWIPRRTVHGFNVMSKVQELPESILEHHILVNRDRNSLPKVDLVDQVGDLLNYHDNHKHHVVSNLFVHIQKCFLVEYLSS
jgi:uncharacterized cupin superfamily protein